MTAEIVNPGYAAPSALPPTFRLTHEQIEEYRRDGFLVIQKFVDVEEVRRLCELYSRLFHSTDVVPADRIDLVAGDRATRATIPQLMYPAKYVPELLNTQTVANAKAILQQLLGPDAVMNFDHAITKPPHNRAETPWHQDEAYWESGLEHRSLSIWVALQQTPVEMGCMTFLPGSHGKGVFPHRHIENDPAIHGLEIIPGTTALDGAVSCPIPAGGATLHDCQTLHRTAANSTDAVRRAYIMSGAAPARPRSETRIFEWRKAAPPDR